jgi:hypothetical protein
MLIWVPLMGSGVLGGFVFAAVAGEEVPAGIALIIGVLSALSGTLAVVPTFRHQRPGRAIPVLEPYGHVLKEI